MDNEQVIAPQDGVVVELDNKSYPACLRLGELRRFEQQHRSVLDLFSEDKPSMTLTEARDLLHLGLVGGGMKDSEATRVVASIPLKRSMDAVAHATAILAAALVD